MILHQGLKTCQIFANFRSFLLKFSLLVTIFEKRELAQQMKWLFLSHKMAKKQLLITGGPPHIMQERYIKNKKMLDVRGLKHLKELF